MPEGIWILRFPAELCEVELPPVSIVAPDGTTLTSPKPALWLAAELAGGWGICPTMTGRASIRLTRRVGASSLPQML